MTCLGQQQSWDLNTSPYGGCRVHPPITPAALQSWLSALCRWGKKLHLRSSWLFHAHPPGTYSGPESFGIVLFHFLQTRPVPAEEGLDQRWSTAQLPSRQEEMGQVPVPALGSWSWSNGSTSLRLSFLHCLPTLCKLPMTRASIKWDNT